MVYKTYYNLTKPGIIYGNLLTAAAGFLLASKWHIDFWLLVSTLAGTSLVIASACVFNNYIDRGIDIKMARTKKRALVSGLVSPKNALVFATVLGLVGFLILIAGTNNWVVGVGVVAFVDYVVLYGISKRRSVHGTVVGSISGAAPILAGYVAARGHFDAGAAIVFLMLVLWQMPHFYAIALYRFDDYKAAGVPVWPAEKGVASTRIQILAYIIAFMVAISLLTVLDYTGYIYLAIMLLVSLAWLRLGLQGFKAPDIKRWARKMFLFSLVVIMVLSLMLSIGGMLA